MTTIPSEGMLILSREAYDSLDRTNFSRLKMMERSPAHYASFKRKDSDPMKQGRACHAATLEPELYEKEFVVWDGRRAGKEWDAFKAEHEGLGREILTPRMDEVARTIANAVRTHPLAKPYITAGAAEHSLLWTHKETGIPCKARLDFVSMHRAICDLKCVRDASPRFFHRTVENYLYHEQAALYVDGYKAVTGQELPYVFLAVEWDIPYAVTVYRLSERMLREGREKYRQHLDMLVECKRTGVYPAYSTEEMEIDTWDGEEDAAGLGLTFNDEEKEVAYGT